MDILDVKPPLHVLILVDLVRDNVQEIRSVSAVIGHITIVVGAINFASIRAVNGGDFPPEFPRPTSVGEKLTQRRRSEGQLTSLGRRIKLIISR